MSRPSPSLETIARRLALVESRLADLEGPYAETMYRLHRTATRNDMRVARLLEHLNVPDVTEAEVDAALDSE